MRRPFYTSWNYLQAQYRLYWLILLTYLPGMAVLGLPLTWLFHSDNAMIAPFLCWGIPFAIVSLRIQGFLCPRCDRQFCVSDVWPRSVSFYTRKCVHCGLPKWSGRDETDADQGAA